MRRVNLNLKKLLLIAVPSIGLLCPQAWASATLTTTPSTCTGLDCGGSTITGNYVYEQTFSQGVPFSVQLFSSGNECLRVSVTSQTIDTELALVSPDNRFWVNDDFNGLRPRIVANTTIRGWYTLQVTKYDGGGPGGPFTFKYGRYSLSNPNCSNPTSIANSAAQIQLQEQKKSAPVQLISP